MKKKNATTHTLLRADIILLALLATVALVSFLSRYSFHSKSGNYVTVTIDTTTVKTLPLKKDTTYEIKTSEGGINILHIKDHKAYIESANCPDKLCVHQKSIQNEGETLVCLPHKVVVSVVSSTN